MNKNLSVINQNNKLMLKKSKSLMNITNNILSNDDWIQRLWDWADENNIPDSVWIEYKTIDGGYWSGLPRDKEKLLNLVELNIHGNYLTELPKEVCNLNNLTSIYLEIYYLKMLPNEIVNLVNLTKICVIGKLLTLPKQLCKLTSLTELCLQENQLVVLPKEIGNLVNLTVLDLFLNQLTELPEEIARLNRLKELCLTWNHDLILTPDQKTWIQELIENGCKVDMDDDLMERTSQAYN